MSSIAKFLSHYFFLMFAILAPIHAVMAVVGILIAADFVTGIWAARKRSEKITSAAMRNTLTKMAIYQTAVVTGFLLGHFIMDDVIPVAKLVAAVIGTVEFKSLLENANTILGVDIFKELLLKLSSKNDLPPKN
jgi:hypothetical protein